MDGIITIDECGRQIEDRLNKLGIKTHYLTGFFAPQEQRYNFSGGAYTDSQLKRAMNILNNMQGLRYEKNKNGGFTVLWDRDNRQFIGCGNCSNSIKKAIANAENGKQKGFICFGLGSQDYITASMQDCVHILIAGSAGSGKSCLLNSLIMQLLCFSSADLVLIDPKQGAELGIYEKDIHDRIITVAKTTQKAVEWLSRMVNEMENRYNEMSRKGLKNYDGIRYVIVIDELADLMMSSKSEVEEYIIRLAQKGRAAGIHLIIATQDPRVSVVTGLIKYNMPTKVCLKTANARHSMNLIDCGKGAELLGKGDSYIKLPFSTDLYRCQCPTITDQNIIEILTK